MYELAIQKVLKSKLSKLLFIKNAIVNRYSMLKKGGSRLDMLQNSFRLEKQT